MWSPLDLIKKSLSRPRMAVRHYPALEAGSSESKFGGLSLFFFYVHKF